MTYECSLCNYTAETKFNFEKHLKTKKHVLTDELHKQKRKNFEETKEKIKISTIKNKPLEDKILSTKIKLQKSKTIEKKDQSINNVIALTCSWCERTFSNHSNLARHKQMCNTKEKIILEYKDTISKQEDSIKILNLQLAHANKMIELLQNKPINE